MALIFERTTRAAVLGARFRDPLDGATVTEGLRVTAYPSGQPQRRAVLPANRSGIHVLRRALGLNAVTLEVRDEARRFQPFRVAAPTPGQGLFNVTLASAPARPVPAGVAVVRADLWDATTQQPAAWAVLEVSREGETLARGWADTQGRIALLFPYPAPPANNRIVPAQQKRWEIVLSARYQPRSPPDDDATPDLDTIFAQPPANIGLTTVTLQYGQELILRSNVTDPVLFITNT